MKSWRTATLAAAALLIGGVGFTPQPALADTSDIGFANGSAETASTTDPSKPASFSSDSYGTNTTAFTWVSGDGHTGDRSLKVDVTQYTSGDAKWAPAAIPVIGGKDYKFGAWYKSSVAGPEDALVEITKADGTVLYRPLGSLDATSSWKNFSVVYTMPMNSVKARLLLRLEAVGTLRTDDYTAIVATPPQGFTRGLVSVGFDDGWKSIRTNGLPLLQQYGIPSTQFIITGSVGTSQYMTLSDVRDFKTAGHEIADHTVTHPKLTTVSATQLDNELANSKDWLESNGFGPIKSFAEPNGDYNDAVVNVAKRYFRSARTTDTGYESADNYDQYRIKVQNVFKNTTQDEFDAWVNSALTNRTWLVLVYHQVADDAPSYGTTPGALDKQLQSLKASGATVLTQDQALDEIAPQVASATNAPPTPWISSSCSQLACSFDGSGSWDNDGTISAYSWDFGDGSTGASASTSHTYTTSGTYTATLTVTDNRGATTTLTKTVSVSNAFLRDLFTRTLTTGLGKADMGGPWTIVGTSSNFSVNGSEAAIKVASPGTGPTTYLGGVTKDDVDVTLTTASDKVATGTGIFLSTIGRRITASDDYRVRVRLIAGGTVGVSLIKTVAGTATLMTPETTLPSVSYAAGDKLKVRLQVTGLTPTTLRTKVWRATATEPTTWLQTTTDSTAALQTAGTVGFNPYLAANATNAPVVVTMDDLVGSPSSAN